MYKFIRFAQKCDVFPLTIIYSWQAFFYIILFHQLRFFNLFVDTLESEDMWTPSDRVLKWHLRNERREGKRQNSAVNYGNIPHKKQLTHLFFLVGFPELRLKCNIQQLFKTWVYIQVSLNHTSYILYLSDTLGTLFTFKESKSNLFVKSSAPLMKKFIWH